MEQTLVATSVWLHALASVIFIGFYLVLALIYLPILATEKPEAPDSSVGAVLSEISRRSRLWLYLSILVYILTGIVLMLVDPNYLGIGNFSNPWSLLMLLKHVVIVGMIVLGFWFNAIWRVGPLLSARTGAAQALSRFRLYVNLMAITGALVLLLTAISQIQ